MTNGCTTSLVPVQPGDVIAERFRIERVLGHGGMGVVVAARHLKLDELVAIKFLLPQALSDAQLIARFDREARAAAKIKSEHVARVTDVGQLPSGAPYIVMEYLEGEDLASHLRQRGSLPIEEALDFLLQACEAVAEAHCLGIVHRDLKPANLFLANRPDGTPTIKVLDFGISKTGSTSDAALTHTSAMMGSPLYMSPEQIVCSRDVDARSDVWALGTILYEMLTGRVPFDGTTLPEVCIRVVQQEPPPLRSLRPDVPTGLESVVTHCLKKPREERFANVAELAIALADFAPVRSQLSIDRVTRTLGAALHRRAPAIPDPATPPAGGGTEVAVALSGGESEREGQSRRAWLLWGGVAALLILGVLVVTIAAIRDSRVVSRETTTAVAPTPSAVSTLPSSTIEATGPSKEPSNVITPVAARGEAIPSTPASAPTLDTTDTATVKSPVVKPPVAKLPATRDTRTAKPKPQHASPAAAAKDAWESNRK